MEVAVYGPMIVAAISCEAVAIAVSLFLFAFSEPGPGSPDSKAWADAVSFPYLLPAIIAGIGAAALVGPGSDLANFLRAVVGVLAGLVAWCLIAMYRPFEAPGQYLIVVKDGRTFEDAEAHEYEREHPGERHRSSRVGPKVGWKASKGRLALALLLLWVVAPAEGVIVAFAIADGSLIAVIGATLAMVIIWVLFVRNDTAYLR